MRREYINSWIRFERENIVELNRILSHTFLISLKKHKQISGFDFSGFV